MIPAIAAIVIFGSMIGEARISVRHDAALRAMGAIEPRGDVYGAMQVVYPATFVAMLFEAVLRHVVGWSALSTVGVVSFAAAKALKYWAIMTLGERWTFRVLVPPGSSRITSGPYRLVRHPNYIAVVGELVGAALWLRTPIAGLLALAGFGALMRRRIEVEERALAG